MDWGFSKVSRIIFLKKDEKTKQGKSKKDHVSFQKRNGEEINPNSTKKTSNRGQDFETNFSSQTSEKPKEESYYIITSWLREWLLLETSSSNSGACLNYSLFDLENVSLEGSNDNDNSNGLFTSTSTSHRGNSQRTFLNNMGNNLSSFFNSFNIYPKTLEVDMQLKKKHLDKHCKTLSNFLNDQGITSGTIDFPQEIIEENGYQLVKLLEFFGGGLNISVVKQDGLFNANQDSMNEQKSSGYKSKSKQNSINMLPDLKSMNNRV